MRVCSRSVQSNEENEECGSHVSQRNKSIHCPAGYFGTKCPERGMLRAKLVRKGFKVNVKVVERIYREERL